MKYWNLYTVVRCPFYWLISPQVDMEQAFLRDIGECSHGTLGGLLGRLHIKNKFQPMSIFTRMCLSL